MFFAVGFTTTPAQELLCEQAFSLTANDRLTTVPARELPGAQAFSLQANDRFATASAQELPGANLPAVKNCNHGGHDLWEGLRLLPVQFIGFDSNTITWKYQDDDVVTLGTFLFDEKTQYISQEKKRVSGLYLMEHQDAFWLCYHCSRCHALLIAYELKAGSSPID